MQRKRKSKILIILLIILLIATGCKKENTDALRFKEEFEQYNDSLSKVNISESNPFVYTKDIKENIESEKALVIFYANPKDENSRKFVKDIIELSESKGLKKIYYIEMDENNTYQLNDTKINNMPSLVSVIRKNVDSIADNKEESALLIEKVVTELNTCDINVGC